MDVDFPDSVPWFVKEADKNWGRSVQCCGKPSECLSLTEPGSRYVVQQHLPNPLLMHDGRKCHIKFYMLLVCREVVKEDGKISENKPVNEWSLYTRKDGYLSISPNKWDPTDLQIATQVTIIRSERISMVLFILI